MNNMQTLRIGWIGTGVMGAPMAGHVLEAGHALAVHTRTKSKAADLLQRGATWAASPAEAADGADFVFSMRWLGFRRTWRRFIWGQRARSPPGAGPASSST